MTIFNDIDLNGISVNGTVENVPHTMSVSNTSSFPTKIDPIKKLDYSTANTIHFTRTIGTGRFGLIEGYRD